MDKSKKLRTVALEELPAEIRKEERKLLKPISVTCRDCKNQFIITPEEQQFFKEKKFDLPKRCKPCRIIRRQNNIAIISKN